MKNIIYILLLLFLFQNSSCKKTSKSLKKTTEITKTDSTKNIKTVNNLFVKAKNGLNYRDKPNGKILGKFLYNKQLHIIAKTNSTDEISDNGKLIKGRWVKVLEDKNIVYVFDAYLTNWKDVSQLINENEFYINIDSLYKRKVQEFKNDTTEIKEINIKKFVTISNIRKEEFENVFKQNIKSKEVDSITKNNNKIIINCLDGKTKKFEDINTDIDEEAEVFHYSTTFEKIKSHLIISSGWEWGDYYLVNYETCKTIKLNGFPIFNSDYSKMICINDDLGDEGIFLNSYDGTNVKLRYHIDIPFTPSRSVLYKNIFFMELVSEWNDGKQNKISTQYFKMTFKEFLN